MASRASRARKKLWFWTRWSFILARHLLGTCSTVTIVAGLCLVLPLWLKIVFRYLRSGPADANDQIVFWVYCVFALYFLSQMIVLPGQRTAVAEVAPLWYAVTATVVRGLRAQAARLHAHAALVRRRATRRMARGAAGPAAAAVSSPSPPSAVAALPDPGEHAFLPIVPVLLPFLAPPERLALWRLSRAFAEAVWRSSPTSQLSLSKRPRPWLPSLVAATQLASDSSRLLQAVSAGCPRFLPPATFRAHLRSLALTSLQFTRDELLALATALPALRHLHLWRCTFVTPDSTPEAATAASASSLPDQGSTPTTKASSSTSAPPLPSHQLLHLHSLSYSEAEPPHATPLSLVHPDTLLCLTTDDPAQLTHFLATRSNPRAPLLGAAPLLFASLRTLKIPAGDSTALVTDDQLALLLLHLPALWEVWLPRLQLEQNHGHRSCSWGLLRLQDSHELDALTLAALPLGCIGRVLVERQIWVDTRSSGELEVPGARALVWNQAWPRLQDAADRLEFESSVSGWSHLWAWSMPGKDQQALCQVDLGLDDDEPGFALHLPRACAVQARQLAELAAARVQGGTLVYSGEYIGLPGLASTCDLSDPAYALRPLRALSRSVRSMCLRDCAHVPADPSVLFAFLPDHVQRLVVKQQEGRGAGVLNPKFAKRVFWRS